MASLQTLRNKGGIIVAVVIGIALLAFVLGDMLTSGSTLFGSSRNNVGEIDGTSVTYQQYSSQVNTLTEVQKFITRSETISEEQSEALQGQAWEYFVRLYAVDPMLEKAGITVSTEELEELLTGANASPVVRQAFSNPETGEFDLSYMKQFVAQIDSDPSGRMAMFWSYLQNQVGSQALIMKYKTLVDNSAYITAQQAAFMAGVNSSSYNVRFVAKELTSISDSTVNVTDAEMKDYYNINKARFERTASRTIEYVTFETIPSDDDYDVAAKYIASLADEFAAATNVQQFVALNSQSPFDSRYYKQGEINDSLGVFAFTASTSDIYRPEISGNEYTIARISDVKVLPDSVNISIIALNPTDKVKADSIAAVVRGGADFAQMAAAYSMDKQSGSLGGLVGTVDPQTMPAEFSKPMVETAKGGVAVVETPQSIMLIKINDRIGESKKVQLGTIRYTVEPSETTRSASFAKAGKFLSDINEKGFDGSVNEQQLLKRSANVNGMQRELQGVTGSREVVRWAHNAEKIGAHSDVLEFGDTFVIASLTSISDAGIAPFDAVKTAITAQIRTQKKGEMIAKEMVGESSLDNLAQKIGQPVIDGTDINYTTFIAPQIGFDPAFAGGVCGIKGDGLSKPIIGGAAVYVAQVVGVTENPISPAMEKERLTAEALQSAFMAAYQTMIKQSSITDERYRFY